MKNEMDIMRMDERQRFAWLLANRGTLMVVGVVWLLMIAFELSEGRTPQFLIVMVPMFAGLRFGFYYYYARDRDVKWIDRVLFFGLVGLGHLLATVVAWVREFATGSFFPFVPAEPSHGFWSGAARVLEFPVLIFLPDGPGLPDWLGIPLMVLNSLLWAGGAYALVRLARRRTGAAGRRGDTPA